MATSILSQTTNFFRLYRYICGDSEVPDIYHFWGAVSLLAATVEDRVWYQKFKHEQLFAHLYVVLVGPSGLGKGTAISHLVRLAEHSITVNKYRGRVTSAHLIDYLGKMTEDENGCKLLANPKLWLIMDELQNDIGSNKKLIEEFIFLMTELYTASNYKINTGTRTHGQVNIERPILNWLVGTTEECLRGILTKELLNSGFTARTCFVFGEYDFNKRLPRIKYPADYEEVFHHLCCRLWAMQRASGPFLITDAAEAELDKWYMTRPKPEEELLYSSWKRHHDLMIKFSMILCLADGGPLVIQHAHILQAKHMVDKVFKFNELLVAAASETVDTRPSNEIARYLAKKGTVDHTSASRYFRTMRGMNGVSFRNAVGALMNEGEVKMGRGEKGGVVYTWVGGRVD